MTDIDIDDLVRLETEVWNALVDGDAAADVRMLSEDFLGVYPAGMSDRDGHAGQLAEGPSIASFKLTEPHTLSVADGAVMLSYRAVFRRASQTDALPIEEMFVSSLWCRRGDRWVNVFSQDTPTAASPVS